MTLITESLWPKRIVLPQDPLIDFLREQGEFLKESTDGLLRAEVRVGALHSPAVPVTGSGQLAYSGQIETVDFHILPVNGFLASLDVRLFSYIREVNNTYPVVMQVFPDENSTITNLANNGRSSYMSAPCADLKEFTTEYIKIVQSLSVINLLGILTNRIQGMKRSDMDNERLN